MVLVASVVRSEKTIEWPSRVLEDIDDVVDTTLTVATARPWLWPRSAPERGSAGRALVRELEREGVRVDGTAIRAEEGGEWFVIAGARDEDGSADIIPTLRPLLVVVIMELSLGLAFLLDVGEGDADFGLMSPIVFSFSKF